MLFIHNFESTHFVAYLILSVSLLKCSVTYCTWHDRLNKIFLHVLDEVYLMFAYCTEIRDISTGYRK